MTTPAAFVEIPSGARARFSWLDDPRLKKAIGALEDAEAGSARFVGGCVRDSLLGVAPKDFDIATTLTPDAAGAALKAAGLGVALTGVAHGTITAIVDHQGIEVTTLRKDVSTDGRRASVAFTRDWAVDARRRDFTVNAIYATPIDAIHGGKLYDPVGGIGDAKDKKVRFIGEPEARIREDFLRILRFFRFSARFCASFDKEGLSACAALKDGVAQLSAERIGAELSAILSLANAHLAISAMHEGGVLAQIWPAAPDLDVGARMKKLDPHAPAPLMLAALYGDAGDGIGARLRMSNAEKSVRSNVLKSADLLTDGMTSRGWRLLIHRLGRDVFMDAALLCAARGNLSEDAFRLMSSFVDDWTAPVFAFSGKDVVGEGVAPGPAVSAVLDAARAQWAAEDFPDEARQRAILNVEIAKFQ